MLITDFFDRGRALSPYGTAYAMDGQLWSYEESYGISCQVAQALLAGGMRKGSHGAVLAGNHPLSWLCVLGLWRAGLAWVPLNPHGTLGEYIQLINDFDVEILFFQKTYASVVQQLKASCPGLGKLVCIGGLVEGCLSLPAWIASQPPVAPQVLQAPEDLVAIMPTDGTTGRPKGVMQTHRNLGASVINSLINTHYAPEEPIIHLAVAPMVHSAGFLSLSTSARGGTVVVLSEPEPMALLDAIEAYRVTELFLPSPLICRLLETPGIEQRDFSSLRYLIYDTSPMALEKLRRAIELFGPVMMRGYGLAEAPGAIACLRPEDHFIDGRIAPDSRLSACGLPPVAHALVILDDEGQSLTRGKRGEICLRGDIVMKGYYKDPEKTAETLANGWLHTGDVGQLDHEGFLHLIDRKDDVIISGGINVYPGEVEQVLWSHPAVLDCAVIGVPDDNWGEAVKAVVELKPGAVVDGSGLIAFCKEQLGSVKAPKCVDFLPVLPRSTVGKVLKKELRDMYTRVAPKVR